MRSEMTSETTSEATRIVVAPRSPRGAKRRDLLVVRICKERRRRVCDE